MLVTHHIPEHLRTEKICLTALQTIPFNRTCHSSILEQIPEKLRAEKICLMAVRRCGQALQFIPQRLRTIKIASVTVKQSGWTGQHVPQELRVALTQQLIFSCKKNSAEKNKK